MNYKNFNIDPDKSTLESDDESREHLKKIISGIGNLDEKNKFTLDEMLKYTNIFLNKDEIPSMPSSMEYFFMDSIKSTNNKNILSGIFAILSFLTRDSDICKRFDEIYLYDYLIQNMLFSNTFSREYSMDLSLSIYNLIDFRLSQNRNADFIQNFFNKYPISSFMKSRIDIIDQFNFLICFSKYSLTKEIASEIVNQLLSKTFIKELAGQSAWIMYYITKNDINNIDLFFFHPKNESNELNNIFYKISKCLDEEMMEELFYMGYLKFCINTFHHLDKFNIVFQTIISYGIPSKIMKQFEAFSPSSECKTLFIKFLNIMLKYETKFLNDDLILKVLNLSLDSKISAINQSMIFLMKVVPVSSIELITKIIRSEFFINCIYLIGSNVDIIVLSRIIFLIYEKIEPIPELIKEYIAIHAEHNSVEAFYAAINQFSDETEQNLKNLTFYWDKLGNDISLIEKDP